MRNTIIHSPGLKLRSFGVIVYWLQIMQVYEILGTKYVNVMCNKCFIIKGLQKYEIQFEKYVHRSIIFSPTNTVLLFSFIYWFDFIHHLLVFNEKKGLHYFQVRCMDNFVKL